MFKNIRTKSPTLPKGSPNRRLYAIGDVHGCYVEMQTLLEMIKKDHEALPKKECIIVFLGDLIDRGPGSHNVLEHLISFPPDFASVYCIMGNHEEMLLRALKGEASLIPQWLTYGGRSCVESYGLKAERFEGHDPDMMQVLLRKYIPKSHVDYMESMLDCIDFGDYLLVHAGIDPNVPKEEQEPRQMRWMREPFLSHNKPLGYIVVHGHTITPEPVINVNRVGLDTGCYETGVLTAVVIEDESLRVLSTPGKVNVGTSSI